MSLIATLWSLLPIPIGMACLFFAWRIPFQNDHTEPPEKTEEDIRDQALENYFQGTDNTHIEDKKLDNHRKIYFITLFSGLGIGAIILGMATFHPALNTVAKGVFLITIIASIAIHFTLNKKDQTTVENPADDN